MYTRSPPTAGIFIALPVWKEFACQSQSAHPAVAADMEDLRQRLDELIEIGKQILSKLAEL